MIPVATLRCLTSGYCSVHETWHMGMIITGNPTSLCGPFIMPAARITDLAMAWCGVCSPIVTGAYTHNNGGFPHARLGDMFMGQYTGYIVEGVPNTYTLT